MSALLLGVWGKKDTDLRGVGQYWLKDLLLGGDADIACSDGLSEELYELFV